MSNANRLWKGTQTRMLVSSNQKVHNWWAFPDLLDLFICHWCRCKARLGDTLGLISKTSQSVVHSDCRHQPVSQLQRVKKHTEGGKKAKGTFLPVPGFSLPIGMRDANILFTKEGKCVCVCVVHSCVYVCKHIYILLHKIPVTSSYIDFTTKTVLDVQLFV